MTTRSRVVVSWLETLAITSALPIIAFAFSPHDPFLLESDFPWVILGPILIGSRYGFSHGFVSALALVAGLGINLYLQLFPMTDFPTALSLGMLLAGMITGEFRDYWARCLSRLDARFTHQQVRLDEFSREYHLLKASHARLEQQVAGTSVSLRTSLLSIREQMAISNFQKGFPLGGFGERILRIFSEYGGVQMAAVYQVVDPLGIDLSPAAEFGNPPSLSVSNPLVLESLRTGKTIGVQAGDGPAADGVLAAVPLVDVHGQIWGIVTVNEIPFVDFHHRTLELLTIIGGYIGDALRSPSEENRELPVAVDAFRNRLERCLMDVRRFQLPAGLITINVSNQHLFTSLIKLMRIQSRGLDQLWVPGNADQASVICALLPFTDAQGISNYADRLESLLQEELGLTLNQAGITVQERILTANHKAAKLLAEIELIAEQPITETITNNEYYSLGNAA